jgi:steroid delta-isomerase-like uncharacterized protein
MAEPSDLQRFLDYARTFEVAQAVHAWPLLERLFHPDAEHVVHEGGSLGGTDVGRDAVIAGLAKSVLDHDRRFDVRIPEILAGPEPRSDGVWMRYALTLRRAGLPDLRLEGEHLTRYAGGAIRRIEEWLPPGTPERVASYLAEHGPALRPAGSEPAAPSEADRRDLEAAGARSLVRAYGAAKSRADVGAALAACADDFVLETPAFGTRAVGREAVAAQLGVFFRAFPDYGVTLEGFATGDAVVAWGTARLTLRGELLGLAPTHETAELAVTCFFDVADGAIRSERFCFDRAELCDRLGLSSADLAGALGRLHAAGAARGA